MRCKKALQLFPPQCEEDVAAMEALIATEPAKLLNSNHELLRTCRLFLEGGEYDQKELDLLRAKLERPTKAIEAAVEARKARVKEVALAQEKAWASTKAYRLAYDAAVLDLCLREGLGQKYGAPRRAAQERLRTELTRDDKHAQQLEALVQVGGWGRGGQYASGARQEELRRRAAGRGDVVVLSGAGDHVRERRPIPPEGPHGPGTRRPRHRECGRPARRGREEAAGGRQEVPG